MSSCTIAVIPARMGSSRFPGKPLAQLLGRPMIEHVYRRVSMSGLVGETYIATCDEEVAEATSKFGGKYVMTADTHERASDRVAEAAKSLNAEIIVMVQGDEPMVTAGMVDVAVDPMRSDTSIQCVNLTKRINNLDEFEDPNTIKVVMDKNSDALYFSRVPVPSRLTGNIKHRYRSSLNQIPAYRQVCIIPFRQKALKLYSELSPTPLEIAESVDMMRFVEHGYKVRMIETNVESYAVDTPEDLAVVEQLMRTDPLVNNY